MDEVGDLPGGRVDQGLFISPPPPMALDTRMVPTEQFVRDGVRLTEIAADRYDSPNADPY